MTSEGICCVMGGLLRQPATARQPVAAEPRAGPLQDRGAKDGADQHGRGQGRTAPEQRQ